MKPNFIHQSYKVVCPIDSYRVRKIGMTFVKDPDGTLFTYPCNGCDFLSMDPMCRCCTEALTSYFYRNINKEGFMVEVPIDVQKLMCWGSFA